MTKCPECNKELKHKQKKHWTGNNNWMCCLVCGVEILYDLELRELNL